MLSSDKKNWPRKLNKNVSRSKNRRTPVKFGRYQRNLFTFSQTCIIFVTYQILISSLASVLFILNLLEMSVEISSFFVLIFFLLLDIVKGVIVPLVVIMRSHSLLPQLFSQDKSSGSDRVQFYVRRPEILPIRPVVARPRPGSWTQNQRYVHRKENMKQPLIDSFISVAFLSQNTPRNKTI